jgi:hypothetical protein
VIALAAIAVATRACAVPFGVGTDATAQVDAYARRSVQIIALASAKDEKASASLVSPNAEFSVGSGDVGRPLGKGVAGALAMAEDLKAANYFFHGWVGIPTERDPCSPQDVKVEFVTADGENSAPIEFKYDAGILKSASGWWVPYSSGPVPAEAH